MSIAADPRKGSHRSASRTCVAAALFAGLSLFAGATASATASIPLVYEGGVPHVEARINDQVTLLFVLDTGAADVMIPWDVAMTLMRTGTITKEDALGLSEYALADGSRTKNDVVRLRKLQIGSVVLRDVRAAVGDIKSSLLLGQSALKKLEPWMVHSGAQRLILGSTQPPAAQPTAAPPTATRPPASRPNADEALETAVNQWTDRLFAALRPEMAYRNIEADETDAKRDWLAVQGQVRATLKGAPGCDGSPGYRPDLTKARIDDLADAVFYARHPELEGQKLADATGDLAAEWKSIRKRLEG